MKIAKLTAGILLGVLTAYACGGKSTQAGGSNTNWFATCDSSAECGGGLTCWCGLCTKTCTDDCSASAGATCSAPPASCANPPTEMACAVQCAKDADCKDISSDATCVRSICRRKASVTSHPDSGAPLTCNEITTQAQNALQPLRDSADVTCQTNADCTAFSGVSCTNACASTVISNKGLAAIQSQLDRIDQTVCDQFHAQGCTVIEPPCVPRGNPTCAQGKCQYGEVGAPPPDGGTCDTEANDIHNTLLDALDALDKSCKVDADCTRVQPELSCEYGCPVDASTTAAASFAAMRASYESNLCASYNAQGCRPVITGCPFTPSEPPLCILGKCTDFVDTDAGWTCDGRATQIAADVHSAVVQADKKCSVDDDCQGLLPDTTCYHTCAYEAVSNAGAQSLQVALDGIEKGECPGFRQAGCSSPVTPCPSGGGAKCNAGTCSTQ